MPMQAPQPYHHRNHNRNQQQQQQRPPSRPRAHGMTLLSRLERGCAHNNPDDPAVHDDEGNSTVVVGGSVGRAVEQRWSWLGSDRRDAAGCAVGHPQHDPTTLLIPEPALKAMSAFNRQVGARCVSECWCAFMWQLGGRSGEGAHACMHPCMHADEIGRIGMWMG
jgi:hypothetical protein